MNFRVDLILPEEQRSASALNPKSLTRIFAIAVPSVIGVLIAKFVFGVITLGNAADEAQKRWKYTEPKLKKAEQISAALTTNRSVLAELEGWKETHINWHEQLAALQTAVPTNIQLTTFSIQQSLISDPAPCRRFLMAMDGRSISDASGTRVVELETALRDLPVFKTVVKSAKVADRSFVPDPRPEAKKDDRLFRIECAYLERVFK